MQKHYYSGNIAMKYCGKSVYDDKQGSKHNAIRFWANYPVYRPSRFNNYADFYNLTTMLHYVCHNIYRTICTSTTSINYSKYGDYLYCENPSSLKHNIKNKEEYIRK